jgi:hypothetical protein
MIRLALLGSPGAQTHTLLYSNIFEYGWAHIVLYPYHIVFIFGHIHIQSEALGPYRIHIYLNIFKIYFSVSYFWPALHQGASNGMRNCFPHFELDCRRARMSCASTKLRSCRCDREECTWFSTRNTPGQYPKLKMSEIGVNVYTYRGGQRNTQVYAS